MKNINVTIAGPVGSGRSSIARLLATELRGIRKHSGRTREDPDAVKFVVIHDEDEGAAALAATYMQRLQKLLGGDEPQIKVDIRQKITGTFEQDRVTAAVQRAHATLGGLLDALDSDDSDTIRASYTAARKYLDRAEGGSEDEPGHGDKDTTVATG